MAGNRFINPHNQFLDANGDPLSSGTLTYYEAGGTSTLQAIYTDSALSVTESNPVTLDAGGYLPNSLFLQQLSYNVVAKNSSAAEQWAEDDVSNILQIDVSGIPTADTVAALTALLKATLTDTVIYRALGRTTKGDDGGGLFQWNASSTTTAELGTVFASGEGGTGRWLRVFETPWVHVSWFGAFGASKATAPTSITDEITALQSATDSYLKVNFDGDKRYRADGTLTIREGAVWNGDGGNFAEVVTTNTTLPLVQADNAGSDRTNDIDIVGIAFFATTSFTGTRFIDLRGVSRLYFNCEVSADVTTPNGPLASTTMVDNTVGFDDPFVDAGAFNVHQEFGPRTNIRGGKTGLLIQGNAIKWNNGISAQHTEYGIQSDLLQNAVFNGGDISNNTLGGVRLINTTDDWVRGIFAFGVYHEGNGNRTAGQFSPNDWEIDDEILSEVYVGRGRWQQPLNEGSYWHGTSIQNLDASSTLTGSGRAAVYNVLENSDFSLIDAASTPANLPRGWAYSNGGGSDGTFTALSSSLPPGIASGIQIDHSGSGAYSLEQTIIVIEGEAVSLCGWVWADGDVTDARFHIKPNGSGTTVQFSFETPTTDSTWYFAKVEYIVEATVTQVELGLSGFTGPAASVVKLAGLNSTRSEQNFRDYHKPVTDEGGNVYGNLALTTGKLATPVSTTALLEDVSADVNTNAAKVQGSQVFNTTTQAPVWSEGNSDASVWNDATGSTAHSPI